MKQHALLCFALGLMSGMQITTAAAQSDEKQVDQVHAILQIHSSPDSARVFVDGLLAGLTPLTMDSLQPGLHHLRIQHQDSRNWLTPTIVDSVFLAPGERTTLRFTLLGSLMVLSTPEGASVYVRDSLLGQTPLVLLPGRWSPSQLLVIQREGYENAYVDPSMAVRGVVSIPLKKLWSATAPDEIPLFVGEDGSGRSLRLYITGGVGVLAAVASAYFKIAADNRQADYLMTGDPGLLSERRRLDTAAGVSLLVTQASLGLFSYFLLEE